MLDMLKHYTIEQLQKTDIDLLLPLYFWYCKAHSEESNADSGLENHGGKLYRRVDPKTASWIRNS